MKTAKDVLKAIKDNDVKYVDLRFTDPRGKWQHVTFDVGLIDEEAMADGLMFDGSSIAGWRAINESDMTLMPDPTMGSANRWCIPMGMANTRKNANETRAMVSLYSRLPMARGTMV